MQRMRDYTVLDLEMTGLAEKNNKIIEIGAVKVRDGKKIDTYGTLVNPHVKIEPMVTELTGITDEMLLQGEEEDVAVERLLRFIGSDRLVGHNVSFDYRFIKQWAVNKKIPMEMSACDTLKMARALLPEEQRKKLESLCEYFHIERVHAHRALDDAIETWQVYEKLADMAEERGMTELFEVQPLKFHLKRQTPATLQQVAKLKEYVKRFPIQEEIPWKTLTRSQASRLYDRFRTKYGKIEMPKVDTSAEKRKKAKLGKRKKAQPSRASKRTV